MTWKKSLVIIGHVGVLYAFFLLGRWLQQTFNLFIPGSIIGMLLLFLVLLTGRFKLAWVEEGAAFLLRHLPLFFIPVTVGIMEYTDLLLGEGFLLVVITIISTLIVMAAAGWTSEQLARGKERETQ